MVKSAKKPAAKKPRPKARAVIAGGDPVAEQGSAAAAAGLGVEACPYEPGDDLSARWRAGFDLVG